MIAVISPAKTLDFDTINEVSHTFSRMPKETRELVSVMKTKSSEELKSLMNISDDLALLNEKRYQFFKSRHNEKNSKPCLYAFKGDVYIGLEAENFSESEIAFAQDHLRILSGLYGLLRPLDLIQPYRLEMGTRLAFDDYRTLYDYWNTKIVNLLNSDLRRQGDKILLNLASNEYFKAIDRKKVRGKIVDVEFLDFNNGEYKIVSFFAKKARGMMSRFMITNQISNIDDLRGFESEGYMLDNGMSGEDKLVFKRG